MTFEPKGLVRPPQRLPWRFYLKRLTCFFKGHDWLKNTEGWKRCRRCRFEYGRRHGGRLGGKLVENLQHQDGGYETVYDTEWVEEEGGWTRKMRPNLDYVHAEPPKGLLQALREQSKARRLEKPNGACPDPLNHHVDCKDQEPKACK